MSTQIDTALARRLLEAQLLDPATLTACLEEVRAARGADPDVSLALVLLERRLVPGEQLDPIVSALVEPAASSSEGGVGAYRVVRPLATGGMGVVYEVEHRETGARCALKTIHAELLDDPEVRARFRAEAELCARLDHPHVVPIHEAHLDGERPYLIQDLLTGGNLQQRLADGPLPLEDALRLVEELGQALAHAHARQVIHRDLKPLNVLFDERGEARLIDFGLARSLRGSSLRLTVSGTLLGTPNFMPPEQARGDADVGTAGDVYGLGGILFACLTGRPPFPGAQVFAVLEQVLHRPCPSIADARPELDRATVQALDRLLGAMLAKDPAERPALEEVLARVNRLRHGEVGATRGRPRGLVLGAAALLLLALAFGVVGLRLGARRDAQTALAAAERFEEGLGPWHLGLVAGAEAPAVDALDARIAALAAGVDDLPEPDPARALLARLRAARRLLDADAQPGSPSGSSAEQLVDAVLLARAGAREPARARLEAALPGLAPSLLPAARLLQVQLCDDLPRLRVLARKLPPEDRAARAHAVQRFSAALRDAVAALTEGANRARARAVARVCEGLRVASGSPRAVAQAKREAFEQTAPAWEAALKRRHGHRWLELALAGEPQFAVGPRLLAAGQAAVAAHLARYEADHDRTDALAAAVELDHLLAYALGSTWTTGAALAKAVELPVVNEGGIDDPRVRTLAAGVALRGSQITQPAFKILLQRADPKVVARVLEVHPTSQAFRILLAGERSRRDPKGLQRTWIDRLRDALTRPGRGELAGVWVPEVQFQIALGMTQVGTYRAAELERHAAAAFGAKRLLETQRIEPTASILAGARIAQGDAAGCNRVFREAIGWLRRRLADSLQVRERLVPRWQRSLIRLHRSFAQSLVQQQRGQEALALLKACDPILTALGGEFPEDEVLLRGTRAYVLRSLGRAQEAWDQLGFARLSRAAQDDLLRTHTVPAEEVVILARALHGDDAARALLRRVGALRFEESKPLRDLRAQLLPR